MQGKGKHSRHKSRKPSGKPPRWLVLGALAASATSAGAQVTAESDPLRWMRRDALAQVLPARRGDGSHFDAVLARDAGAAPAADAAAGPALTVHRFEIAAGPLGTVLAAFEKAAGVDAVIQEPRLRGVSSPGVNGLYTVEQALQELLAGTEITYRFDGPRTVRLDVAVAETIDVTASPGPASPKYTEPLLDTPQTLTVIPQRLIQEQGASTLRDVLRNVTGISIQAGEGGGGLPGDNLSIRGFAARNDIFVDGVRDFGAYSRDPFNIEQIEVVKGPSSLYGGRGTTGGSLNITTKRPHLEAAQLGTAGAGDADFGRATIDLNQPLGDSLPGAALRINGMWTQSEVAGREDVQSERWGIAPSFAFGLGTPTRWTFSYSHLSQDNVPDYGLPWVPATNVPLARHADKPVPVSFSNFYGLKDRDYEKTVAGIATADVEHDFAWGQGSTDKSLSLRSLVRHGRSTRDSIITAPRFVSTDSTDINRQLQSRDLEDQILTQQTNLTARFVTGPLSHAVVTGVEAARETSENFARSGPTAPVANLFNPNPDDPYLGPITRTGARTESTADTAAVYASDTVRLNERWQVAGGLRWDHFDIDYRSVAVDGVATDFERTDRMLSWRGGVVHKPSSNGTVYLSYGTSFNPSADGNTGLSLTAATVDLEPEKSRGAELGTKWDLPGARLSLNAAVFQTEKTNARTPGVLPGDPPTVLQGEQRIRGIELGASGQITRRWSAYFGYTYLDSEVVKSNNPAEVGNPLANTPEHSASLWTTYRLRRGFEVGGGAQFVDDRYNNNTATRVAPDYLLFDLMGSYEVTSNLTLRLNLNNVTDEVYIDRVGGGHFIPGAGRSITLTSGIAF